MEASSGLVSFITRDIAPDQLERLFTQPYAVVAILRSLPPLARHALLRFAFTSGGLDAVLVNSWATAEGSTKLGAALQELAALRVMSQAVHDGQAAYVLNTDFQAQLRRACSTGLLSGKHSLQTPPGPPPSAAQLAAFARQQWEALLLYLVSGEGTPPQAPPQLQAQSANLAQLLAEAGLMLKDEFTLAQSISQRGFQFLLSDMYSQLWAVVRQYLLGLQAGGDSHGGGDLAVAANFLLRLGLQGGGAAVCYSQVGRGEQAIAAHMCQLGLLMPAHQGAQLWLHPTRLAAVLAGGGRGGEAAAAQEEGHVIVESNFRVYAYTTSAVQVAVLRVFVRCDVLLPNLFVGTVTRESARAALELGITADQLAAFLRQHVHPRAAARSPPVPTVVTDQLRLWEKERSRLQATSATLYERFESAELYEGAVRHARQLGALLYHSDDKRQLAVVAGSHEAMRAHLRDRKAALGL